MVISKSIHVVSNGIISFFVWLSNIPLYKYTASSLLTHLPMDTVLLPCLGYCDQCFCEHEGACLFKSEFSQDIYAQEWDCRIV